ncbi:LPS O-antigen length regulator Wzz(fepE) [Scandinavium sp. NPDC088450]|uniref:LPS O-antigen length regulator Wzz(fepE) n=1 Tax=Scandinavium sp. NPDC088450 TaxID=3364514 RepID=UPI00385153B9
MSTMDIKTPKDVTIAPSVPAHAFSTGQDIDLLALLDVLWSARKRILAFVFGFALAGLAVSLLLPQKWTSNAVITPAERTQLMPLNTLLATMRVLGVDNKSDSTALFNLFIKKFNSSVLLEEYVKSSPEIMNQLQGIDVDPIELHRAVVTIAERMKAVDDASNKKENNALYNSWTLSFTGPDAAEAQVILAGYIKFVSAEVVKQTMTTLHENVTMKLQTEKQRLELDRAQLENAKDTKIKRLNYSLQVAQAAGINKPVYSNGQMIKDDPDFSVTLGTEGINKKLEIEKSIKDVSELNADILNREYLLKQLESLNITDVDFPVVNYQLEPSLPIKKDGPGKSLIILLAALLGGAIACGTVLLQSARESRRATLLLEESAL